MIRLSRFGLLAIALAVFLPACASAAPDVPQDPKSDTAQAQEVAQATSDCRGDDLVSEIQAEYLANKYRANETYSGNWYCLKGTISGFSDDGAGRVGMIGVQIGDARTSIRYLIGVGNDEERARTARLKPWMMEMSVGDRVEVECQVGAFVTESDSLQDPEKMKGTPIFTNCDVAGAGREG